MEGKRAVSRAAGPGSDRGAHRRAADTRGLMQSRVIGEASRRNPAMSAGQSGALAVIARLHHPEHSEGSCLGQEPSVADPHARMPSPRPRRTRRESPRHSSCKARRGLGWDDGVGCGPAAIFCRVAPCGPRARSRQRAFRTKLTIIANGQGRGKSKTGRPRSWARLSDSPASLAFACSAPPCSSSRSSI